MRTYDALLPYAFKRFSLMKTLRTGLPTAKYYLTRKPLPESEKPALFTMNILPPMMTVWYHFAQKYLGDRVDTTIFDSSGLLDPKEFPNARVQKFINLYAATKSEEFLHHIAKNRKIGWLCDDDMFFLSSEAVDVVERELAIPNTASVSFRPRRWWEYEIDGKRYPVSSSYCIALNREIFVDKEKLTLGPENGNTHPAIIDGGKSPSRYDTFDKANEILLEKDYRCFVIPEHEQEKYVTGFSGMSGGVILLHYFKKPEQVLDYFTTPSKKCWQGTMLYGLLASLLAICTIQELYEQIKGKPYPLHSLPSRAELEKVKADHMQYMRKDHSFDWVYEASEKLRDNI